MGDWWRAGTSYSLPYRSKGPAHCPRHYVTLPNTFSSSSHHLSLNREGCSGTTDDFANSFLHFSLFSTALWDLPNSRPVHFLMLSSHLFFCLPCFLPPFTVHCRMVLARPDDHTTAVCVSLQWSGGLRVVRLPVRSWHRLPHWSHGLFMRCVVSCGSTSIPWLVFYFGALL